MTDHHATDPFGTMGDAQYSDGLAPAGKRLKLLYLRSDPANTASVTVVRAASNGLSLFSAAGAGVTLTPGGSLVWEDLAGIGPLTTGSNDALTLTPSAGTPAVTLLAVYSHMIDSFLYLPDYPIGHLIAFQVEEQMRKAQSQPAANGQPQATIGSEFERIAKFGNLAPDLWMKNATGAPVGPEALLQATERALTQVQGD